LYICTHRIEEIKNKTKILNLAESNETFPEVSRCEQTSRRRCGYFTHIEFLKMRVPIDNYLMMETAVTQVAHLIVHILIHVVTFK
jgi:hypothetical protein